MSAPRLLPVGLPLSFQFDECISETVQKIHRRLRRASVDLCLKICFPCILHMLSGNLQAEQNTIDGKRGASQQLPVP